MYSSAAVRSNSKSTQCPEGRPRGERQTKVSSEIPFFHMKMQPTIGVRLPTSIRIVLQMRLPAQVSHNTGAFQEVGARKGSRGHGRALLAGLLLRLPPPALLYNPGPTCPAVVPLIADWIPPSHQSSIKRMPPQTCLQVICLGYSFNEGFLLPAGPSVHQFDQINQC